MQASNIRIVLVETSHPGNIGGAARAMKNMCLNELYLVNPEDFPSGQATARASGADDVLHHAVVTSSLEEALADCTLVIGTSARYRRLQHEVLNPRDCGQRIVEASGTEKVAIIFGREDSGLTNEELNACHFLVHIPTNPEFQSLNLAAAVQLISYEVATAGQLGSMPKREEPPREDDSPASVDEMEGYYRHMEEVLVELGYLHPPYQKLLQRIRRIYSRARLTKTELHILRGILSAAKGKKYLWMKQAGLINEDGTPTNNTPTNKMTDNKDN